MLGLVKPRIARALLVVATLLPACAASPRAPASATAAAATPIAPDDDWSVAAAPPPARPRLAHTITLGESWGTGPQGAPSGGGPWAGGPTIVIQNQVSVVNHAPTYVGGYGWGAATGPSSRAPGTTGAQGSAPGGSTGWEGAEGRPAAPGHTPNVGGNWSTVPSYGPR